MIAIIFRRIKTLEKVNTFTEEDAEAVMQEAVDDLQKEQQRTSYQISAFKADLQSLRDEVTPKLKGDQQAAAEGVRAVERNINARLDAMAAQQKDQEAEFAARWTICEKISEEVRRSSERHAAELQAALEHARQRQAELKDQLNFHENLIMEEQHGSRNAAVAVSTSARLDAVVQEVQAIEQGLKAVWGVKDEVSQLKRDQEALLSRQEDRGTGCSAPQLFLASCLGSGKVRLAVF